MYCEECGTQLNDDGECAVCLTKSNSVLEDIDRDEEAKRYREEMEKKDYSKIFISDEEKYVTSIGNGYIENYLLDGTLKKAFLVVSSKRAYLKGRCYLMQGRALKRINEEKTIDLKDINGSGFLHKKNYLFSVLSALVFVLMVAIICGSLFITGSIISVALTNPALIAVIMMCGLSGCWMGVKKGKKEYFPITFILMFVLLISGVVCSYSFTRNLYYPDFSEWLLVASYWGTTIALLVCGFVLNKRINEHKSLRRITIAWCVLCLVGVVLYIGVSLGYEVYRAEILLVVAEVVILVPLSFVLYKIGKLLGKLSNRTWFNIMMPSGNISFNVRFYSIPEMQEFQKRLIVAKNQFEEQVKEVKMAETVDTAAALSNISRVLDKVDVKQGSLTEEIQSAVKLFEQGLISKEEFEQLKKKLLG